MNVATVELLNMLQNNDHKDYLLYKPEEKSLDAANSKRSSCISSLSKMLRILYQFSIGSCIHSLLSCSEYFRNDEPYAEPYAEPYESIELDGLSGNLKQAPESKKAIEDARMKKKINIHFQSHLQKWKRKYFPFKVTFHLLLVVLVTVQVSGLHIATECLANVCVVRTQAESIYSSYSYLATCTQ